MPRTHPSELLIRQRVGALTRSLPAAQKGNADSLHLARVATRRLREALPLVASGSRQRKLERQVRGMTRALGPVRELDVAMDVLDELEAGGEVPRAALLRLRRVVSDERRVLHEQMLRQLGKVEIEKLGKRAIAEARKGAGSGALSDAERIATARARAARRAEALEGAIENASGMYLPDRLHEVRIAVKKLRYALELAGAFSRSRAEARLRTLKKAQDVLGRMHDLEVLIARTRAVQGAPGAPTLKLSGDLDRLVRVLEAECRRLHGHYMASRASLTTICDHVVAAAARRRAA
ncbi:MAG: CHAD domain-containing protein [Vicinamibacterales bacterium]